MSYRPSKLTLFEAARVLTGRDSYDIASYEYRSAYKLIKLLMHLDFKCIIKPSPYRSKDSSYHV